MLLMLLFKKEWRFINILKLTAVHDGIDAYIQEGVETFN